MMGGEMDVNIARFRSDATPERLLELHDRAV
jgi:hypothetical protein